MLLQQRRAESSIMVNIYCRMHSYIILTYNILPASTSTITFSKLPRAASQMLHYWFQSYFFPLFSPLPLLVAIQGWGRLSSVNLHATFWDNGCDRGRAAPEAADIFTAHRAQGKGVWLQTKPSIRLWVTLDKGESWRFILFSTFGNGVREILKLSWSWEKVNTTGRKNKISFFSFFLSFFPL